MKQVFRFALLGLLLIVLSAFDWINAGADPYTGTRQSAIERSGFPPDVQAMFLRMMEEDKASESANRSEGIYYKEDFIPSGYTFDWTMFGRDKRETSVIAHTERWKAGTDRMARVYRVVVPNGLGGGKEYVLFFPKVCFNPSGIVRELPVCPPCPPGKRICPVKK